MVPTAVAGSLFPAIVEWWSGKGAGKRDPLVLSLAIASLVGACGTILMFLCGEGLIVLVFGSDFQDASQVAKILGLSIVPFSLLLMIKGWMIAHGHQVLLMLAMLIGGIACVLVNIVVIPRYGVTGAATVMVGGQCVPLFICACLPALWRAMMVRRAVVSDGESDE